MDQKELRIDSFYFLHIPKTGGTFMSGWILPDIYEEIKKTNIKKLPIIRGHDAWSKYITDSTYIMTILRDPAKRTVSHYAHHVKYIKDRKDDVDSFLQWVEEFKESLSNFQSKNIIFDNVSTGCEKCANGTCNEEKRHWWFSDANFINLELKKEDVYKNLNRINLVIDNKYLQDSNNRELVKQKISMDLNLQIVKKNKVVFPDPIINQFSKKIYNSLDKKTIDYLYSINNLDSEIYFSDIYTKIK